MSSVALLMRKEFMYLFKNLKSTWIMTLVIIGIFTVISPDANLIACIMVPYFMIYGVMAHEEQNHSDALNYTLPVTRRDICTSKYLLGILYTLGTAAIVTSILSIGTRIAPNHYGVFNEMGNLNVLCILVGGSLIYTALIVPIIYKFGCIKMRMVMFVIYFVGFGAAFAITGILSEVMPQSSISSGGVAIGGSVLLISMILYVISYLVGLNILNKKEVK